MIRKRDRWTRAYAKRSRPKTPAPKTGWVLAELAQLTLLPETTVRYYVHQHILRPSEFRGTVTRYQRRELMRLVATVRLKSEGTSTLKEIRHKLDSMSDEELDAWLRSGPVPAAAATALGIECRTVSAFMARAPTAAIGTTLQTGAARIEQWQRVALLPGLELMFRVDAKDATILAAQRIIDEYVVQEAPRDSWIPTTSSGQLPSRDLSSPA